MHLRSKSLGILAAAMLAAWSLAGCSSGPSGTDFGFEEDATDETAGDEAFGGLRLTITNPPPDVETRVSGSFDLVVKVEDDQKRAIRLKVEVLKATTFTPVEKDLAGPQTVIIPIDTTLINDGRKWSVRATASTEDGTEATATVKITVDNQGPVITPLDPTPAEGGNFLGDLKLRFKVTDAGAGVTSIVIDIEDGFHYEWSPTGAQSQVDVDTGEILVPTSAWPGGEKTVTVEALDGIADHLGTFQRTFSYVQRPAFLGGSTMTLSGSFTAIAAAGVSLEDGTSGVVLGGQAGLAIFVRDEATGGMKRRAELAKGVSCSMVSVKDLDLNGLDDIVAFCGVWLNGATDQVVRFLQVPGAGFAKPVAMQAPSAAKAMTFGRLNADAYPDMAFALEDLTLSTGISMSDDEGETVTWGTINAYSGAQTPKMVAIGRFATGDRNAVLVAHDGSSVATVFPIDAAGQVSSGVNSSMELAGGETTAPVLGMSAVAAMSFASQTTVPETAVFTDLTTRRIFKARVEGATIKQFRASTFGQVGGVTVGVEPKKMLVADLDQDGTSDVAVLCKGAHLVHVFFGVGSTQQQELIDGGSLLAGPVQDLAIADLDSDGFLDLVALSEDGTQLTWLRWDPDQGWFVAAPMVQTQMTPVSMAVGRFSRRETGETRSLKDVAILGQTSTGKNQLSFFVSERKSGLALQKALTTVDVDMPSPRRIVAANIDRKTNPNGPDDLVLTTAVTGNPTSPSKSVMPYVILEDGEKHNLIAVRTGLEHAFYGGEAPTLVAAGDLTWTKTGANNYHTDLAFLAGYFDGEGNRVQRLQIFEGQGDGTFKSLALAGSPGVKVAEAKQPKTLIAAPIRRYLSQSLSGGGTGDPYFLDLLTANSGTGDFSVYPNGDSGFLFVEARGRDFAVGANPKAVAVGFLAVPLDGSVEATQAAVTLPDVVTLAGNEVFVSYNTTAPADKVEFNPEKMTFDTPQPLGHQGREPVDLALADMNHDSHLDIVVLNRDDATVTVYLNLGNLSYSQPFTFPTGVKPIAMTVTDLDANGCPDVITADEYGNTLTFLKNIGACD